MAPKEDPVVLFSAIPGDGHFNPLLTIATYLRNKDYDVAFMTSPALKPKVEAIGAEWYHLEDFMTPENMAAFMASATMPFGVARLTEDFRLVFVDPLPTKVKQFEDALISLREKYPSRPIIYIEDAFNWCFYPFRHGRPLPKGLDALPKSIGIGVTPILMDSIDTAPTLLGLPPDSTPSGRLRNEALLKLYREGPLKPLLDFIVAGMEKVGADMTGPLKEGIFTSWYTNHDAFIQLCSPSMEYERSDLPSTVQCVGVLAANPPKADLEYPAWWSDVSEAKSQNKRVVFVSQGTTNFDYSELVFPTINAMADREDVVVVIVLGMPGAALPAEVPLPSNVRVLDYFPYDAVLPYTDVFVSNVGYGSFGHAVRNAVPIVAAGEAQEKMETAMRIEAAGMGVNLRTQMPNADQVKAGIEEVLKNPQLKKAAIALQEENKKLDALAAIERKIKEMAS